MKELTIEDKAKRYDEALHKAKRIINVCVDDNTECRSMIACIQQIFPELKESEDERILKQLRDFFKNHINSVYEEIDDNNDVLAWLEKQNEQKLPIEKLPSEMKTVSESLGFTTQKECDDYNKMVTDLIMSDDGKGEQKPAWSEEDERIIKRIKSLLYAINENDFKDIYAWLEFLKNRVLLQSKQEWSKEDEGYYDAIIAKLEVTREDALLTDNEMDFLKSLEKRVFPKQEWSEEDKKCLRLSIDIIDSALRAGFCVQLDRDRCVDWLKFLEEKYTWKPSDEQMEVLLSEVTAWTKGCPKQIVLESLYNDLKRLLKI